MYLSFLDPFYEAVAWVLIRIHEMWSLAFGANSGAAWALSIVLLTILMRIIVLPLFIKQMKSQRKMAALQPQVTALRKKYKNDKQTMNQELMKLYQENGANPLMGCLPLVVQLPVFWALFDVLEAVAKNSPQALKFGFTHQLIHSAQHADIISATIASRIVTTPLPPYHLAPGPLSAKIVVGIAVAISATTTYLTMNQSMKRGPAAMMNNDPNNPMASSQKYMKYVGPLFAISGLYWQFGLVIYWVTSNLWTLGQTSILYRRYMPGPEEMAAIAAGAPSAAVAPGLTRGAVSVPRAAGQKAAETRAGKGQVSRSTAAKMVGPKTAGEDTASGRTAATNAKGSAAAGRSAGGTAKPTTGAAGRPAARTPGKPASSPSAGAGASRQSRSGKIDATGTPSGRPAVSSPRQPSGRGAASTAEPGTRRGTATERAESTAKGNASANGDGKKLGIGRLRRGKPEPEETPAAPAVKLVRQQRVRQSRSKRSGKR